jgi:diguanylate cyclase (GGDEF)-like protein
MSKRLPDKTIVLQSEFVPQGTLTPTFLVINGAQTGMEIPIPMGSSIIGRDNVKIPLGYSDDAVSRNHAEVIRFPDKVIINDLDSTNGVFIDENRIKTHTLSHGEMVMVGRTILKFINQQDAQSHKLKDVLRLATMDGLTGVSNRKNFEDRLSSEFALAKTIRKPLSVMMVDLDNFKQFNDQYGHLAGDEILIVVARRLLGILRSEDLLARFGGDEFVVLAPNLATDALLKLAERIRLEFEKNEIKYQSQLLHVTISIGCFTFDPGKMDLDGPDGIIEMADRQLYKAKRSGRNRTC